LTFVLFGENVFVVDNVLARVNSFAGVKSADAYILTKLQYYDDWIMKEINRRLLTHPVLHRSEVKQNLWQRIDNAGRYWQAALIRVA
jgi:hypothetical protein